MSCQISLKCDICGEDLTDTGYYHAEHKHNGKYDFVSGQVLYTNHSFKSFDICDDCFDRYSKMVFKKVKYERMIEHVKSQNL